MSSTVAVQVLYQARNQKSAIGERLFGGLEAPPEAIGGLGAEPSALKIFYFFCKILI